VGVPFGSYSLNFCTKLLTKATNVHNRQAAQLAALLQATGATLRAIAEQLNQSGYCTRRGKAFHPMGVQRLLTKLP